MYYFDKRWNTFRRFQTNQTECDGIGILDGQVASCRQQTVLLVKQSRIRKPRANIHHAVDLPADDVLVESLGRVTSFG